MARFVVQHHCLAESEHWDLMLEQGPGLATWQVPVPPEQWSAVAVPCRRLADHRRVYLDYRGPVSGDRGRVVPVAGGEYAVVEQQADRWRCELKSELLSGRLELSRDGQQWVLVFEAGERDKDVTGC